MNTTGKMACCDYVTHSHVAALASGLSSGIQRSREVKGVKLLNWTILVSAPTVTSGPQQNRIETIDSKLQILHRVSVVLCVRAKPPDS